MNFDIQQECCDPQMREFMSQISLKLNTSALCETLSMKCKAHALPRSLAKCRKEIFAKDMSGNGLLPKNSNHAENTQLDEKWVRVSSPRLHKF